MFAQIEALFSEDRYIGAAGKSRLNETRPD